MSEAVLERLVLGELDTNCWLVSDGSGPLAVVDPAADAGEVLRAIAGRDVAAVVLTHGHFDHIGAVAEVARATGAPVMVHEADAPALTDPSANGGAFFGFSVTSPAADRTLEDGDAIEVGDLILRVMHTPGHTPGSICLVVEGGARPHLVSGDTLFAGSVGRTDFPGGDARALRTSIARLASLPPGTTVHPGHGPDTTIERESRVNFFWPRA